MKGKEGMVLGGVKGKNTNNITQAEDTGGGPTEDRMSTLIQRLTCDGRESRRVSESKTLHYPLYILHCTHRKRKKTNRFLKSDFQNDSTLIPC